MSFDLFFCRSDNSLPTLAELTSYFQKNSCFQITSDGTQFFYQNEATGVYCTFEYDPKPEPEPDLSRCYATGLSFNLNYNRPSFFAYETMPLVEDFCRHFSLCAEDPDEALLSEPDKEKLVSTWRRHNSSAIRAMTSSDDPELQFDLAYMPEPKATAWWNYMRDRQTIEDNLTEDLFVPSILLLESPQKRLELTIVWPDGIAQFFPSCDYVYMERTRKKFFGTEKQRGRVAYRDVVSALGPLLVTRNTAAGPVMCLPPDTKNEAASVVQRLNLYPIELSQYTRVSSDSFHDVELAPR